MKTLLFLIQLTAVMALYSPSSYADHGHHGRHHKHHHDDYYEEPAPRHYSQPPRQQDPRSHQGLAGGVVGSVLGYEIGNGDPIATGLGAAAGSYLGNGIAGRR
ncbi:MAG: glycine zipper 2TM domain-containing protein [Methylobacter sp.]